MPKFHIVPESKLKMVLAEMKSNRKAFERVVKIGKRLSKEKWKLGIQVAKLKAEIVRLKAAA